MSTGRGPLRAFTLLEVLVAIAILGLGLSIVLAAETGAFGSYMRTARLSQAPGLLRCKMSEVELDLIKNGYSLMDQTGSGTCCEVQEEEVFTCEWRVERVELPELPLPGSGGDAGASTGGGLGALGALQDLRQGGSSVLGDSPELSDVAELLGGDSVGGPGDIAAMVLTIVYPDLKSMLEASIRKITVSVKWREGLQERDLTAIQYVTSPQQGGFNPLAAEGLAGLATGAGGSP